MEDKHYENIKQYLIDNETTKLVKDYSKNISDINTYYKVGEELVLAGNKYGDNIVSKYSEKLKVEIGKKYNVRYLYDMKKLYLFSKVHPLGAHLTISHYRILFKLKDANEIDYYINQVKLRNLGKRELSLIINNKEYERLDIETKNKLINKQEDNVTDFVKNPILIKNSYNYKNISEKMLQKLILEDITSFMKELGIGFSYGTEAWGARIKYAFNNLGLRRLENGYFEGDISSWKIQEKFGYKNEGIRRKKFISMSTGKIEDEYITGLLKEEWINK